MTTGSFINLMDAASRLGSDGEQLYIAEMMSQSIVVFDDMPMRAASEFWGHDFSFRTSIPSGAWRQANQGVGFMKSTTGKSRVGLGVLEAWSQIDELEMVGMDDPAEFRENEDVAFMEGMGQNVEATFWYGNTAQTPGEFMGMAPFYNTIANAQNGANVIDGGGVASSNASIWGVGWGERTIYGLYPRGSKAGLTSEDRGNTVPGYDSVGNPFKAYTMVFQHMIGLCPADWRYAFRIANLDVTTAGLAGASPPDLFQLLSKAVMLFPHMGKNTSGITKTDAPRDPAPGIRPVIYCDRTLRYWLDVQGIRNRNVLLTVNDAAGKPQDIFRGIKIAISDQLLNTEARVV